MVHSALLGCLRGSSPGPKLDARGQRPASGDPRHEVTEVVGSSGPFGHRRQDHGKLPCHVVLRPGGGLVTEAQVDMVDLHLTQPSGRAAGGLPAVVPEQLPVGASRPPC